MVFVGPYIGGLLGVPPREMGMYAYMDIYMCTYTQSGHLPNEMLAP